MILSFVIVSLIYDIRKSVKTYIFYFDLSILLIAPLHIAIR